MTLDAADSKHQPAAGRLYVVATPIGNLGDLSPRAREILAQVDWIACEDTRHSAKLLGHFGIATSTISYHEHNEQQRAPQLLDRLRMGQSGALISDAGTPLISDPGFCLVRLCRQQGISVTAIPGPSAAISALSISGLPCTRFCFAGFLPRKEGEIRRFLGTLRTRDATLVFYLSPHRLRHTLQLILEELGPRQAFLARELSKLHEETWWSDLAHMAEAVGKRAPRGEYTLVVEGPSADSVEEPAGPSLDAAAYLEGLRALRGLSRKDALQRAAQDLQLPRNRLYRLLLRDEKSEPK